MSALASASTPGRFFIRTGRNSSRTAEFQQRRMRRSAAKSPGHFHTAKPQTTARKAPIPGASRPFKEPFQSGKDG